MIEEIVKRTLEKASKDLKEIEGLKGIDFIDLFPTSEAHKKQLDEEAERKGQIIEVTERGNIYLLKTPIPTKYGDLFLLKVRSFDETRLDWEAEVDFIVEDRDILKKKIGNDRRFSFLVRPDWDAVEFKTNDTLAYFVHPSATDVYLKP